MYIYIYIYIYIYQYIKIKTIFSASFGRRRSQGICRICDLQMLKDIWRHFTSDVSYFIPSVETKYNGGERKVCMKWIQFSSWFRPSDAKVSSFIIHKFSRCFGLSFNVSVDFMWMFLSCSIIMIFPWLLKPWSFLLKRLQAGILH